MAAFRGKSFSQQEDQALCEAWLQISQDPILGTNQKKDKLWQRVATAFNEKIGDGRRTSRSLESRMEYFKKSINKFQGCIRQIERLNQSGSSELDIFTKALTMYGEICGDKKGFQLNHVWPILKDAEKWVEPKGACSNQGFSSSDANSETAMDGNIGSENFPTMGDDQSPTNISASRPIGRKKEKLKRRQSIESNSEDDFFSNVQGLNEKREVNREKMQQMMMIKLENEKIKLELRAKQVELRAKQVDQRDRQIALQRDIEDRKILKIDLSKIVDPEERAYYQRKKQEIVNRNEYNVHSNDMQGFSQLLGGARGFSQFAGGSGYVGGNSYGNPGGDHEGSDNFDNINIYDD